MGVSYLLSCLHHESLVLDGADSMRHSSTGLERHGVQDSTGFGVLSRTTKESWKAYDSAACGFMRKLIQSCNAKDVKQINMP